jgi:acetyl-CoA C-acetyltransferase
VNEKTRPVYVLGGNRIPFARSNAQYAKASNQDMLTTVIDGLASSHGLEGERLGEVAAGAVLKHARDINLTRESVLGTKLAPETPAFDVGQACGTGLEAAILVANKIALGQADSAIAGGSDTTSDAPIALNDDLREILLEANAARSTTDRIKTLTKIRPSQIVPDFPRNESPAQASRWASTQRSWRRSGASGARSRMSWQRQATSTSQPRTTAASWTTS